MADNSPEIPFTHVIQKTGLLRSFRVAQVVTAAEIGNLKQLIRAAATSEEEYEKMRDKVEMTNTYDIQALRKTAENLKAAAAGEKYERSSMYPDFEKAARAEGEIEIADMFKEIGEVEEKHEERYLKLVEMLENNTLFETDKEVEWKCLNCGYIHKGKSAPDCCPSCKKPQGWYMQLNIIR